MAYLTTTSSIRTALQVYNCRLATIGVTYLGKLEKGKTSKKDLEGTEMAFAMIDSIVGYKAPALEVLSTGTITITADAGGTITAYVNGVAISGAVASTGVVNTTATNLASSITSTSTPTYTAVAVDNIVTVSAQAGTGANPNGLDLTVIAASMTVSSTVFASGVSAKVENKIATEFDDAADRLATSPVSIAEVGFQGDTGGIYQGNATYDGAWTLVGTGQGFDTAEDLEEGVPASVGEYAVQLDTSEIFIGTATTAGSWKLYAAYNSITLAQINNILNKIASIARP